MSTEVEQCGRETINEGEIQLQMKEQRSNIEITRDLGWTYNNPDIIEWNDGFVPTGCKGAKGRMVVRQPRSTPGVVAVFDDVLEKDLAKSIYDSVISRDAWGVYVTQEQVWNPPSTPPSSKDGEGYHLYLAACAARQFLLGRARGIMRADEENIHGVSVWCLAAGIGSQVEYHIDYAEMFRFQTNITYPPMYAGTLHSSTIGEEDIEGGDFYVNTCGLEHYKEFGYKRKNSPGTDEAPEEWCQQSRAWVKIPYKFNRAILCDGDFAHLSTTIKKLPPGEKRVVVGFNIFNQEIGPEAEKFPEHSAKFNAHVKLSQAISRHEGISMKNALCDQKMAALLRYLLRKSKEKKLI